MKPIIFFALVILLLSMCAHQTQAQWLLGGNNNVNSSADWLGTGSLALYKSLNIHTNGTQRMTIMGTNTMNPYTDNTGWVGIGNTMPMSMLHLGESNCYSGQECSNGTLAGGWRNWMSRGAFICYSTDNMYIGMKSEGSDGNDAIIAWGDNDGNFNSTQRIRLVRKKWPSG